MREKWYQKAWRRNVIDMHIPDWDAKFLSKFDADQYVQMLIKSRAQSAVVYAHSQAGLFNYPTKVGEHHKGLGGRNILREVIERCHRNNIAVVVYTSLIFDRWCADHHPEWRMRRSDGKPHGEGGRHGFLCPNSPYREYVRAFTTEICEQFDFEGIRFDMTFWPVICYCEYCRGRFAKEAGGDLPTVINWLEPKWVAFQRMRERSLADFAKVATDTVRKLKPNASVEHQASTYPLLWTFGVGSALTEQNDFLQGDFYGDQWQGSFVRKLLYNLTPNLPFGFETSFSVNLAYHTAKKSAPLLEAKASAAIADGGAFIFIDAIDPIGTLNPAVYERMETVFDKLMPYYDHIGGERIQDIAVFFSLESKISFEDNGKKITDSLAGTQPHIQAAMQADRWLASAHLPFGIITKKDLKQLGRHKALVLPNVLMMDEEETAIIRDWVRKGGRLYASGISSLVDKTGKQHEDFMLGDVFGVSIRKAHLNNHVYYLAPTPAGKKFFPEYTVAHPAFILSSRTEVAARPGARVLATVTLPWPTNDPSRFSSIGSNPPWEATNMPAIVVNPYGKGQVVYVNSELECSPELAPTFLRLLRLLADDYTYEAKAPSVVEMTMFRQPERKRYVVSFVNFQNELPNIPVNGIRAKLRVPERISRVTGIPDGKELKFRLGKDGIHFSVPRLETLRMVAVEYS